MSELLCRRDMDGDGVNDELSFGEVLGSPNGEWTLGLPAFNSTKSRGPCNRWFEIQIEG